VITCQVELFSQVYEEAKPLLEAHFYEVALHHEAIPLDPDVEQYLALEAAGILQVVTCRRGGQLVGYHSCFVKPHIHNKSTLMAFTDIYYVKPDQRGTPLLAKQLFNKVAEVLRQRGCRRIITPTKLHLDNSRFLEHLGNQAIEKVYELML
jgi:GNAT superfamily N-acetyltransferase